MSIGMLHQTFVCHLSNQIRNVKVIYNYIKLIQVDSFLAVYTNIEIPRDRP